MTDDEKRARAERAERLVWARIRAGFSGPAAVAARTGINVNTYKAYEQGRNGFGPETGKLLAKLFEVSAEWLYLKSGTPDGEPDFDPALITVDVPLVSWVSAGGMAEQASVVDLSDYPTVTAVDLPDGDYIALRVDGPSMNKISPPESTIFVNRRDRRLVANACYIIADETGAATYKRYRPNDDPPYQPASYENVPAPELHGAITVIGRVRRSVIDM